MSKICPNCGKEIEDSALFCPSCGAPTEAKEEPAEIRESRPEDIPMPGAAFGAGAAGGAAFGAGAAGGAAFGAGAPNEAFKSEQPGGYQADGYNAGGYNAGPQASYGQPGGNVPPQQGVPQGDGYYQQQVNPPGKSQATASLVLGIVGIALIFFGLGLISIITSAIGLVMASKAKKLGFMDGTRTAGFVINLIVLILGILTFVACGALVGLIGAGMAGAAGSGEIGSILQQFQNIN